MKKNLAIILMILFALAPVTLFAQYYNETKTFVEKDYTYQCDVDKRTGEVVLYNKENKYTYVDQGYTDSNEYIPLGKIDSFEDDNWTRRTCNTIVNNAFSAEQKARVKGRVFSVDMYIDSQTGKVIEVCFGFLHIDPYATIPLSVYRQIEVELKKRIWFTPTAQGKRLNYIYCGWMHEVE